MCYIQVPGDLALLSALTHDVLHKHVVVFCVQVVCGVRLQAARLGLVACGVMQRTA
jgi:hypothetical protein